jgi:hypothetical protein
MRCVDRALGVLDLSPQRRRHQPENRINLAQLAIQALPPVLANANPVTKVMVKERLMTCRPQPLRYLVGEWPVRGGIADEDVGHDHHLWHRLVSVAPIIVAPVTHVRARLRR